MTIAVGTGEGAPGARIADDGVPRRLSGVRLFLWRAAVAAAVIVPWQWMSGRVLDARFVSSPTAVAARLAEWIGTGFIWPHLWATTSEALIGYGVGVSLGLVAGFVLGVFRMLSRAVGPLLTGLYAIPKVTLAPLFVLYFGIYAPSKIALAAVVVFFLMFYSTFNGVRDVDSELIESVQILGARTLGVLSLVIIPATADWIVTGMTIALPYAFIGAVAGEIIVSAKGLGYIIATSANTLDAAGVFAALTVLMILTAACNEVIIRLRSRARQWRAVSRHVESM